MSEKKLTHLDDQGRPRMVDVGAKPETERVAIAKGAVYLQPTTLSLLLTQKLPKGDALQIARLAGIMGAKRTAELIPLCHPLPLTSVDVDLTPGEPLPDGRARVIIEATARCVGRTGVEMEAMTAVSIAALTLYDMIKAVDRGVEIAEICLHQKSGGKSGLWIKKPGSLTPLADSRPSPSVDGEGESGIGPDTPTEPEPPKAAGKGEFPEVEAV